MKKQDEAANQIKSFLFNQGVEVRPGRLTLPDGQQWIIFERAGKQIRIDLASGVWIRESIRDDWKCLAMPCSVSGTIQAVEFLTQQ